MIDEGRGVRQRPRDRIVPRNVGAGKIHRHIAPSARRARPARKISIVIRICLSASGVLPGVFSEELLARCSHAIKGEPR